MQKQAGAGRQTGGEKYPELIPEFRVEGWLAFDAAAWEATGTRQKAR